MSERDGVRNCTVYAIKIVASEFSSIVAASTKNKKKKERKGSSWKIKRGRLRPCQASLLYCFFFLLFSPLVLAVRVLAAATS